MVVYDLVVIGSGSGGTAAAKLAASMGARVALIERKPEQLGGACLNVNDVPSKAIVYASQNADNWKAAKSFIQQSGSAVLKNKASEHNYRKDGIHLYFGDANFISKNAAKVGKETVAGRRWVVASGATPHVPSVTGLKKAGFLTVSSLIDLPRLPSTLTIIGGGVVAVEMAFALQRMGCKISILENNSHILSHLDAQVSEYIKRQLVKAGVKVYTSVSIISAAKVNGRFKLEARHLGGPLTVRPSNVLIAAGQDAALPRGLNKAGVNVSKKGIIVNNNWQTSNKKIYAVGDVVGGAKQQTPSASVAAKQAVKHALLGVSGRQSVQPQVVFSYPEVAHVGATVTGLMKDELEHRVYSLKLNEVDYGLITKADGSLRVICDSGGKVIGGTIVGDGAGELIGYIALAVNGRWPLSRLGELPVAYPTLVAGLAQIAAEAGHHGAPAGASKLLPVTRLVRR
jgi:pyruvate/2-oxoglutarate dehydrogenase complex dihydrolipoamide dehydrogenase (E3) component